MAIRSGAKGVVGAAVLVGLFASGPASPALAHQPNDRPELPVGRAPSSIEGGRHTTVVLRPVPRESYWDAAMRELFCQEARDALSRGRSNPALLDWILTNAQACRDDRLLVDAFGF